MKVDSRQKQKKKKIYATGSIHEIYRSYNGITQHEATKDGDNNTILRRLCDVGAKLYRVDFLPSFRSILKTPAPGVSTARPRFLAQPRRRDNNRNRARSSHRLARALFSLACVIKYRSKPRDNRPCHAWAHRDSGGNCSSRNLALCFLWFSSDDILSPCVRAHQRADQARVRIFIARWIYNLTTCVMRWKSEKYERNKEYNLTLFVPHTSRWSHEIKFERFALE